MNIGNFMVETCWAEGSYQKGKEEAIAQALKRAEGILKERALIQSSCSAQVEMGSSRSRSQKSFFSDFSLNSPLTTLMGNLIGAPSPYLCGFRESRMEPLGENLYGMFGMKYGYISGDTTYHISFAGGESELEFPLGNSLLGIEAALGYRGPYNEKQDRARLTLGWYTNVDNDAGTMKDSDWDAAGSLWGYTESNTEVRVHIIDLNYIFNFFPAESISIGPMAGYRYQKFDYDIIDYWGTYYGVPSSYSGKCLEYEVTYNIWYLGLSTDILLGDKFQLNLRGGYSPWANAEDRDDHLLTYALREASCDGDAYLINLNANWKFLPNWLLQVGGEYIDIDTEGTQHLYYYAGPYAGYTADVDDKITSSSWLISAILNYRF